MTWWHEVRDAHPATHQDVPFDIPCMRCTGRGYRRASSQFYGDIKPIFDEGVIVNDIESDESYTYYIYNVMCGACDGTGDLAPIPLDEVFKRKRMSRGILRTEQHRPGDILPMGEQYGR